MNVKRVYTLGLAGLLVVAAAAPASEQRTMNRGLHAPPVKAPVVIDGRLDEWDLSGEIVSCKDVGSLIEVESAPKAVIYRPVSDTRQPYLFDAFEGANRANAVRMDEVRLAPEVKASLQRVEAGYRIEAAIPWALFGDRPAAGAEFRMDFGVLFGDTAGTRTVLRAYWENRDANIVADIPSEAKLQPGNWGIAKLEE